MMDIKHRYTDEVLFSEDANTLKDCVEKAVTCGADLRGADLHGADLHGANLHGANLSGANLRGANLHGVDLSGVDLHGANLSGANLRGANLRGADLGCADLRGSYIRDANLGCAELRDANLGCAELSGADLHGANLSGANLRGANLSGANLGGAKGANLAIAMTRILPDGALIGWKKCNDGVIVKLSVPADAKRSHAWGRKCRAEYADVLDVIGAEFGVTYSHGPYTEYRQGRRVTADEWDEDWMNECSNGIHFFITREEAEAWE